MRDLMRTISEELNERPLAALERYDRSLSSPEGDALKRRFDSEMKLLRAGRNVDRPEVLANLPQLRADARRESRVRLMRVVVARLISLSGERSKLRQIGKALESLVLQGSVQQQFCCKLATRLGLQRDLPEAIRREIAPSLKRALITIIEVGAPTTRDAAVEGLGALLKVIGRDAAAEFPNEPSLLLPFDGNPHDRKRKADHAQRVRIRDEYHTRLQRRRLIVLAVAGHVESSQEFDARLARDLGPVIGGPNTSETQIADALYERQDLLRFLPGIARQRDDIETVAQTAERLRSAMSVRLHRDEQRPEVVIAFARFQESVFRTVDTALRRKWRWLEFDTELAAAVGAIPRVLTGEPTVCNAQVRATVAILRTAIRVVRDAGNSETDMGDEPRTTTAVRAHFADLSRSTVWTNHGIAEGCYRGLSQLIGSDAHDTLTIPALNVLFRDLKRHVPAGDLLRTHRRLIAGSCFRRLLVSLTDQLLERRLSETDDEAQLDEQQVERDVRAVLHDPNSEKIRNACQHREIPHEGAFEVSETVIATIAFESDALRRSLGEFAAWNRLADVDRLLLIRILAAQLHALSRDVPEVARHDVLRRVLLNTPAVSLPDEEATRLVWTVLSSLPSDAAEVADLEIQRYTEYRGRYGRADHLPGYVLAMIPAGESSRIDSAIAREIDLTRRHDRAKPNADFAKALYQVTLRGPHESVFDYLIPRLKRDEQADRQTALLFRRHVANVRSDPDEAHMLRHVDDLRAEIQHSGSTTLRDLHRILTLYRSLFADETERWGAFTEGQEGGIAALFHELDRLASVAHVAESMNVVRTPLLDAFKGPAAQIRSDVERYLDLPVGEFDARTSALEHARSEAERMRHALRMHPGLQPPERIMLISLMLRLEDFFTRTIHWFCDEPRHRRQARKEARDPEMFFALFASRDRPFGITFRAVAPIEKQAMADRAREEFDEIKLSAGAFPAEFPGQRERFERFFVDWMTADLDVDMLQRQLRDRWSKPFQFAYWIMTTFAAISVLILAPSIVAAVLHAAGKHNAEGFGFLVLQALVWTVAFGTFIGTFRRLVLWFVRLPRRLWKWIREKRRTEPQRSTDDEPAKLPPYRREAVLLRLTRLIAVPMALTVELDHAYSFPLHASTWVLSMLILLSYVTTRFFVDRELVDPSEAVPSRTSERTRVRQIVAVALSHAFMVAVLLSAIFGSHADHVAVHPHDEIEAKEASGLVGIFEEVARHVDHTPPAGDPYHKHSFFAAVLPRDVKFDTAEVFEGLPIPKTIAEHVKFTFYPTLILTWTALGLFVGVFLEGFVSGKRLRGGESETRDASH